VSGTAWKILNRSFEKERLSSRERIEATFPQLFCKLLSISRRRRRKKKIIKKKRREGDKHDGEQTINEGEKKEAVSSL